MPIRLYHPDTGQEATVRTVRQSRVLAASGWVPAPESGEVVPGVVSEPVKYVPDQRTDTEREADEQAAAGRRKRTKAAPAEGEDTTS
jgi:hypothetical protein